MTNKQLWSPEMVGMRSDRKTEDNCGDMSAMSFWWTLERQATADDANADLRHRDELGRQQKIKKDNKTFARIEEKIINQATRLL